MGEWIARINKLQSNLYTAGSFNQRLTILESSCLFYRTTGNIIAEPGTSDINVTEMFDKSKSQSISNLKIVPLTDNNINEAVSLWLSNSSKADLKFGPISDWDIGRVAHLRGVFELLDMDIALTKKSHQYQENRNPKEKSRMVTRLLELREDPSIINTPLLEYFI